MFNSNQENQGERYRLDWFLKYTSGTATVLFWLGLSLVLFALIFLVPRFRNIYSELNVTLPTPTILVINYNYLLCFLILLYGMIPLLLRKLFKSRNGLLAILVSTWFGFISVGIILGFIVIALYLPLQSSVVQIK